ncbi:hypothetical protein G3576_17440 [Roseomonas stagni]|uniref:DUF4214 domain-containing protein n=1 Tax=Falsiroseomonas algicola TaxID=2716930 RepID=A0A6M1LN59_9PROT|nr:hypothetical protein [Falsiroseomonas algicola]NGM21811.1 hypothetical protein [Falsiroseomonas algicola]
MTLAHLDAVTQAGIIEGWACDPQRPRETLALAVLLDDGTAVAAGRAELFREDLMDAQLRYGWCAFRLRAALGPEALAAQRLRLVEATTGAVLHVQPQLPIRHVEHHDCETVEAVVAEDPTMLRSIDQLAGCGDLFAAFIAQEGLPAFIRAAYGYVLGRPADPVGFASYEKLMRRGALTPFGLLAILADSGEFRSRPRLLPSPVQPAFVFATAAAPPAAPELTLDDGADAA